MPIRSVSGFLLTVLAVCAAAWLGLTSLHLLDPFVGVDALVGIPLALTIMGIGALMWAALALADAMGGRLAMLALCAVGVLAAPDVAERAESAFWDRRTDGAGWYGSAIAWPTSAAGHVRGSLGFVCGGAYAVRLHLDERGRGVGTAQWVHGGLLYTPSFALSPLDGPDAFAIRGELVGDRLEITALDRWAGNGWTVRLARP